MAWVRLDDHFDEHPKLANAGPLGLALWVTGLAYCNRNLTDGFIPRVVALRLIHEDGIDSAVVIDRIVGCGLWDEVDGGYQVHDYADYQPSREDVLREREQGAVRQRRFREGRKSNQSDTAETRNGDVTPLLTDVSRSRNERPVPNPVPNPRLEEETPTSSPPLARAVPKPADAARADPIWDAVAELCGKPATKTERSDFGDTISQLRHADATPEQIAGFGPWWWRTYPEANLTHRCLRGHWGKYLTAPARPPQLTDLSPGMQAILTTDLSDIIDGDAHRGRDHLSAKNGRPPGVLADPRGNSPGVVTATAHVPRGDAAGRR